MKKPVIGTRSHGNTLKVSSGRFISIFVSRLDPSVSCDALSAYINDGIASVRTVKNLSLSTTHMLRSKSM